MQLSWFKKKKKRKHCYQWSITVFTCCWMLMCLWTIFIQLGWWTRDTKNGHILSTIVYVGVRVSSVMRQIMVTEIQAGVKLTYINMSVSPPWCFVILQLTSLKYRDSTRCLSCPQTSPSHKEKWSGEPSRISWANALFCDSVTSNIQNILWKPTKKSSDIWMEINKFKVAREVLRNN